MARRVKVDNLTQEIKKIMTEYGDDVQSNLNAIVGAISKKGAQTLRKKSKETFNGKRYAAGWTTQIETGRVSAQGTIYNADVPGLPHLLEHGHAMKVGGRTVGEVAGRPHISVVEEQLVKEYEKEVKSKL